MNKELQEQKTNDRVLLEAVIDVAATWGHFLAEIEATGNNDRFVRSQLEAARFLACLPIALKELIETDYADAPIDRLAEWVTEQTLNKIVACKAVADMEQGK